MKTLIACTAAIITLASISSANAKGCLKGAVVGGVAGHYSGHHGLLGAAAGCVIGRHEAKKREQMDKDQAGQNDRQRHDGEEHL
jgi:outer membrane lipoprotein SlyB